MNISQQQKTYFYDISIFLCKTTTKVESASKNLISVRAPTFLPEHTVITTKLTKKKVKNEVPFFFFVSRNKQ